MKKKEKKTTLWYLGEILRVCNEILDHVKNPKTIWIRDVPAQEEPKPGSEDKTAYVYGCPTAKPPVMVFYGCNPVTDTYKTKIGDHT